MVCLLDACIRNLQGQGMTRVYIDAIGNEAGYFEYNGKSSRFLA